MIARVLCRSLVVAALACAAAHAGVITISPEPVGGRVTSDIGGIDCPGTCVSTELGVFGTITLLATPDTGINFQDWTDDGFVVSATPSYTIPASWIQTLKATFWAPPSFPGPNNGTATIFAPANVKIPVIGIPAPTIALVAGTLPAPLTLAADGTITGTPSFGSVGSYPLTVSASSIYGFTTAAFTLTVQKAAQSIGFPVAPPATVLRSAGFVSLPAQATSGLDVVIATTTPAVCQPAFLSVTLVGDGNCVVQLDQPGDSNWNAAPQLTLSIAVQSAPAIASSNIAAFPVGQSTQFQLNATGYPPPTMSVSGTLPPGLAFDPATNVIGGRPLAGTTGSYAVQVIASNGIGANAVQSLEVNIAKGAQSITPPPMAHRGHLPGDAPFDVDAYASSFLPLAITTSTPAVCSVNGARVTLTGAQGNCTLTATQAGDASYLAAAPVTWSIAISSARIDTIAGGGILDGIAAIDSILKAPVAVVQRADGSFLVADAEAHRVRLVSGGTISTFAGTGVRGFSGDGGAATAARLDSPSSVAVDGAGNVYVADAGNHRIRRISPAGTITTFAGSGLRGVAGDGGAAIAAALSSPRGLAFDAADNLHFIDAARFIRKVTPAGVISTVAGNRVSGYHGDGGPATLAAFNDAQALAFDAGGQLYVSDALNFRVRRISAATGTITTFAGNGIFNSSPDGGAATATSLKIPRGIVIDSNGHLLIAEFANGRVRKVDGSGIVSTVAGGGGSGTADGVPAVDVTAAPEALAASPGGAFFFTDRTKQRVRLVNGAGTVFTVVNKSQAIFGGDGGPGPDALVSNPRGIARDATGNLYIVDAGNGRVRKVSPAGLITTVAGSATQGFGGDGGPATAAALFSPQAVAVDASGNLYISDAGNYRVRKVTPQGIISTFAGNGNAGTPAGDGGPATAATLGFPSYVAVAPDQSLYIADASVVRRVSAAGIITTVAGNGSYSASGDGGPATSAGMAPQGIAFDAAGNLFIADYGNVRIRKVTPAGTITTLAGTGAAGYSGDGGPATSATFRTPTTMAADPFGNVYVADASNNVIRRIDAATGIITSLTDGASFGFAGEAEPVSVATVGRLEGLATDPLGNLYIADTPRGLVRKVTFDSQPGAFAFPPQSGVAASSLRQSAAITPSGYDAQAVVTVTGGEYSVGCSGTFTAAAGSILPAQSICVRHTASGAANTTVTTTLAIGGVSGTFSSTTAAAPLPVPPRLGNISTRMQVLTGNDVMIGGFVIVGSGTKTVVVRARGPSLAPFGITNALANPALRLVRSSDQATIATNDDFGTAPNLAALQASGFAPDNALESAILVTLGPGAYTAIVSGVNNATGVGIVEVFEVDHPETPLANISTRGQVLTGNDVMIGGFVIQGDAPQTVVIRARGPSLIPFGIPNALANPVLQLFSGQTLLATNDNWGGAPNAAAISASGFAPDNALEAAIMVTLAPGAYTAIVTGAGGGTGVGIIEVFAD